MKLFTELYIQLDQTNKTNEKVEAMSVYFGCAEPHDADLSLMRAARPVEDWLAVSNVNITNVHNTYVDRTVIRNNTTTVNNNQSFHGPGGSTAQASRSQMSASRHSGNMGPTQAQAAHAQAAHAGHVASHGGGGRGHR